MASGHSDASFGGWSLRQAAIAVFLGAFLFHALGAWTFSLTCQDESRFAEAAREMRQGGDWIVPHFDGQFRFDKPPLTYWCQAAAMAVFGETEFAARFHSILSAALLAVVVCCFGARMSSLAAGVWAAVIFSTNLVAMIEAKAATADMLMTLFATLAFWSGWELIRTQVGQRPPAWRSPWWWLFYAGLALAFLAKGPIGWAPLAALALYRCWEKQSGLNRAFRFELGLPVTLGLVALWGVPALLRTQGEFLRVGLGGHVLARMTTGFDGHGAKNLLMYLFESPVYLVVLAVGFLGWSIWFPWAFKQLRAAKTAGAPERYLLSGIIVIHVVFTLGRTRLPHYTLPAFPLVAILLAKLWSQAARSFRPFAVAAASLAVFAVAAQITAARIVPRVTPGMDLARECEPFLRPESAFGLVDLDQSSLVWYFRSRVRDCSRRLTPDGVTAFMAQPGPRFCVMPRAVALERFPALPPDWRRVDSADDRYLGYAGGKLMLTVVIKP